MGANVAKYMHFYIYLQVKHDKLSSDMSVCFFFLRVLAWVYLVSNA